MQISYSYVGVLCGSGWSVEFVHIRIEWSVVHSSSAMVMLWSCCLILTNFSIMHQYVINEF